MAKVIRNQWVYKTHNHIYRYLPRRHDGPKDFDYVKRQATPEEFPDKMPGEPPKLWVAWLTRDLRNEPKWIKERVYKLFGKDPEPGEIQIFKNVFSNNFELWHIKHLIDLRPMQFPQGEPKPEDVNRIEITPDGKCLIHDKEFPTQIKYVDTMKQFTPNYLRWQHNMRDWQFKDVYEDNVHTPSNISIVG